MATRPINTIAAPSAAATTKAGRDPFRPSMAPATANTVMTANPNTAQRSMAIDTVLGARRRGWGHSTKSPIPSV